jgi:hypothetical protein
MLPTSLEEAYKQYNRQYWNNQLPLKFTVKFKKNLRDGKRRMEGLHLRVYEIMDKGRLKLIGREIHIDNDLRYHYDYALIVLLHEMIHLYLSLKGVGHAGHGKHFRAERKRLILAGAFDELV